MGADDQAWFSTDRWQRLEREVDAHIERGETTTFESTADFLSFLEKVERDQAGRERPAR